MSALQTWLLYHNALSTGVAIEDILKYARTSKDKARDEASKEENAAVILELKRQLAAQEAQIQLLMMRSRGSSVPDAGKPFQSDTLQMTDTSQLRVEVDGKVGSATAPSSASHRPAVTASTPRLATASTSSSAIPIAALETRESPREAKSKRPKTPNAIRPGDAVKAPEPSGAVASKIASKIALSRSGSKLTGEGSGEEVVASPASEFLFKQPDTLPPRAAPLMPYDHPSGTSPLAAAAYADSAEEGDRERSYSRRKE
jgi:hypothetical protein